MVFEKSGILTAFIHIPAKNIPVVQWNHNGAHQGEEELSAETMSCLTHHRNHIQTMPMHHVPNQSSTKCVQKERV